jgi:hypothetical protein
VAHQLSNGCRHVLPLFKFPLSDLPSLPEGVTANSIGTTFHARPAGCVAHGIFNLPVCPSFPKHL